MPRLPPSATKNCLPAAVGAYLFVLLDQKTASRSRSGADGHGYARAVNLWTHGIWPYPELGRVEYRRGCFMTYEFRLNGGFHSLLINSENY